MSQSEVKYEVPAQYGAINAVKDICEPWVVVWGGDEWGYSMANLVGACHTSYGLSDEDCAVCAEMLLRNIIAQKDWVDNEGHSYGFWEPEPVAKAQERCRELREYWRQGGNLQDERTQNAAKVVIDQMPSWMFE